MLLEKLRLRNFRNYTSLDIELFPGKNVLVGDNGQGKTNVIEAIHLCGTGKSYRTPRENELIKWGESAFYTGSRFLRNNDSLLVEVAYSQEKGKRIRLDGVHQDSAMEYIGAVNIVIFGPDDLRIIKGGPGERRRFLDLEISSIYEGYRRDLAGYRRILSQRNRFLKDGRHLMNSIQGKTALDVWDKQLIPVGVRIMIKRAKIVEKLSSLAHAAYKEIASTGFLKLDYLPSFDVPLDATHRDKAAVIDEYSRIFQRELNRLKKAELLQGITLIGPHRDNMVFSIDDVDIRTFGSQGQQRTAMLALRLGELDLIRNETGEDPILLLDDVSSELDPSKRAHLWKYIDGDIQTVITATDQKILNEFPKSAKVFKVQSGSIKEVNGGSSG